MYSLRPLEEQFGEQTVCRIRVLQTDLATLPLSDGAGGFYIKELIHSLEAGLLLASLHLATTLVELFARDLLVYSVAQDPGTDDDQTDRQLLADLERRFEDDTKPRWTFAKIVDELESRGVVDSADAQGIKKYYKTVRVPIHHGLTRRFLRSQNETGVGSSTFDPLEHLRLSGPIPPHQLEARLEDTAIDLVGTAVGFVTKYSEDPAA